MNRINLSKVCKITFVKKQKTDDFQWVEESENLSEWFKNLFRKNKIKKRYIEHWLGDSLYTSKDFLEKYGHRYAISVTSDIIYEKAHVILWYSDYNHGNEIRYFDTNKEAENYFNKLIAYAKQFDIPFIDFYIEE